MPTRRNLLQISAAGAAAALVPNVSAVGSSQAKSAENPGNVPLRRLKVGELDSFVILTALFGQNAVVPGLFPNASAVEVSRLQEAAFLPPNATVLSVNVLAVNSRSGLVLVDSGPTPFAAGRGIAAGLAAEGIGAADVRHVIVTHAHGDHIGGLVDADGKPAFANAQVHIGRAEAEYWLGETKDPKRAQAAANAKRILGALGERLVRHDAGEIVPGFVYVPTYGHTPGHMTVEIGSGTDRLVHIGDAAHVPALQLPRPEWSPNFDVDPKAAAATRKDLLKRLAGERLRTMAVHFPFPGVGHVATDGAAFRWVPEPWGL